MSLVRKKSDYDYNGIYQLSSLNQIATAERRLSEKKRLLEDIENEKNLLEEQAFRTYKSNINYLQIDQKGFADLSRDWLRMLYKKTDKDGNKLDGRKSYKEKDVYNYYISTIKELLNIDDMEDINILDYNFGEAAHVEFTYLDHRWQLKIPHIDGIKIKSYQYYGADVFKLKLTHKRDKDGCIWDYVGGTYEEDELKDIMSEGIEKYCEVNDIEKV